jgi:predicted AAA+ superfamily ATPase
MYEMHGYHSRSIAERVETALGRQPAVALLGPRQCGKSTLARKLAEDRDAVILDLQDRRDRAKLAEPELFFEQHRERLVCLDEIQLVPDLFPVLRSEIDAQRNPGRFLILGSASRDLLRQSHETLAGRIAYLELTPFHLAELPEEIPQHLHWFRGGFPESLLVAEDEASVDWRLNFIRTFLERDIPSFGFTIPLDTMDRLWRMLAHLHGQTLNFSKLAGSVDVDVRTLKKYLSLLEHTYMIRVLPPLEVNVKKRLVKSPRVYVRDSGILHTLLELDSMDEVLGHPVVGASWEGYVIENLLANLPRHRASFVRTAQGAEADLVLDHKGRRILVECKASKAPKPSRGLHQWIADLQPDACLVVAPVDDAYTHSREIEVCSPSAALARIRELATLKRAE